MSNGMKCRCDGCGRMSRLDSAYCDVCWDAGRIDEPKPTGVMLDREQVDCLTVMGLRQWKEDIPKTTGNHPDDIAADALRLAAIDVLLAYAGVQQ